MAGSELEFYDIASGPPVRPFAVNPCKTRYALNFKKLSFKTVAVELPEVTEKRKSLGCAPVRKHADGSDFYTLPVVKNTRTGEVVGDSLDIALYLDREYGGRRLVAAGAAALTAAFNAQMDGLWVRPVRLGMRLFPLNPANGHVYKAEACRRSGAASWEAMDVPDGEERAAVLRDALEALRPVASWFEMDPAGPFLNGADVCYGDFIVGGWLWMYSEILPAHEFAQLCDGNGGVWGRLHAALAEYRM